MSIRPHNASQVKLTQEQIYEIIREPIVTEKSTLGSQFGQVTFKVGLLATKPEIKVAIEQLFDRKVKAVNTLRQKGKVKDSAEGLAGDLISKRRWLHLKMAKMSMLVMEFKANGSKTL